MPLGSQEKLESTNGSLQWLTFCLFHIFSSWCFSPHRRPISAEKLISSAGANRADRVVTSVHSTCALCVVGVTRVTYNLCHLQKCVPRKMPFVIVCAWCIQGFFLQRQIRLHTAYRWECDKAWASFEPMGRLCMSFASEWPGLEGNCNIVSNVMNRCLTSRWQ